MDASDERINAWLDDLEPDEPLAVAQAPYEPPRRWHPIVVGAAAMVGVLTLGIGVVKFMNAGGTPAGEGETPMAVVSPSARAEREHQAGHGDNAATVTEPEQGTSEQPADATPAPGGASTLGIAGTTSNTPSDEIDPYDQTDPGETSLTQHLVRAGNQWMTHAGAEEAVRATLTKEQPTALSNPQVAHVRAVQSLPLANVGRIVQVRAWVGDGVRSLWAVPVKDDGTVMANPWLVTSEQRPLIEAVPEPTEVVDKEEAIAVLTQVGWTNVEVAASGVHPNIPDILIVRVTGVPPHGNQPVTNVVWLGGPAGSRHVMGV